MAGDVKRGSDDASFETCFTYFVNSINNLRPVRPIIEQVGIENDVNRLEYLVHTTT